MQAIYKNILRVENLKDNVADVERRLENEELTLDEAADALLAEAGKLGREHGTYTEVQLARRIRLESLQLPSIQSDAIPEEVSQLLLDQRIDGLIEVARLKPIEEICFRLSVSYMTAREIAHAIGIGRRRIDLHLRQARRKMRQVYKEGPFAGWFEVYLSEVRRGKQS